MTDYVTKADVGIARTCNIYNGALPNYSFHHSLKIRLNII